MKRNTLHILFFLFATLQLQAQTVKQGAETVLSNNKISFFAFKKIASAHSTTFLSDYIISYKGVMSYLEGDRLLEVTVRHDSATRDINVMLVRIQNRDTIKESYHFIYADSMGLIFNSKRSFTEIPEGKFELLLGFDTDKRKYLHLYQLMDKNLNNRKHYRFEVMTMKDISENTTFLAKQRK